MCKRIIQERYLKWIGSYYLDLGYYKHKKISSYIKNEFEVFLGPDAVHPGSITLRPKFTITNDDIQTILEKVFPGELGLCTFYRVQSMDLAFECGIFDDKITHSPFNYFGSGSLFTGGGGGSYYYSIEEDTDLEPILDDHKYFMEKVTFPLFDKMSNLEGIDHFLNGRILEGDMDYFMSEKRQMFLTKVNQKREILSGLIAAKLINSPYLNHLLLRYKTMWEGNNYILDDVETLMLYFNN